MFAPIVSAFDFGDHVAQHEVVYWFAILMAVNLQTSFLTPPFGFALFYMKAVVAGRGADPADLRGDHPVRAPAAHRAVPGHDVPDIALWLPRVMLD